MRKPWAGREQNGQGHVQDVDGSVGCHRQASVCRQGSIDIPNNAIVFDRALVRENSPDVPVRLSYHTAWLHRLTGANRLLRFLSIGMLARIEMAIMSGHKQADVLASIRLARRGAESLLSSNEAFALYSMARAQSRLLGDMAEVGVYQGCSAKIVSMASGGAPLHLFDTFCGLPQPGDSEKSRLRQGLYAASLESVKKFLSGHKNIHFYPGIFSAEIADPVASKQFSLVHLDVDLHASTLACLEFFYPRMLPGGIILTHDYSYLAGVRNAFAEFLHDKAETAIELPSSQALVIKL